MLSSSSSSKSFMKKVELRLRSASSISLYSKASERVKASHKSFRIAIANKHRITNYYLKNKRELRREVPQFSLVFWLCLHVLYSTRKILKGWL